MAEHIDPSLELQQLAQEYLQLAPKVSNLRVNILYNPTTTSAVATESRRGALAQKSTRTYVDRPISRQVLEVIEDGLQICNKYSAIQRGSKEGRLGTTIVRRIDKLVTFDWAEALENPHQNVCFSLRAIVRVPVMEIWGWIKPNRERGPLLDVCMHIREVEVKPTDQMCNGHEQGMSEAQWIERNEWIETRNVFMRKVLAGNLFGEEDHPQFNSENIYYAYNESKHVFERSTTLKKDADGYYYVLLGALNISMENLSLRYNCVALAGVNKGAEVGLLYVPNNPLR
ncbi:putative virion structural protein [Salmonella phage SPFM10]|nr:putative virion structural protein [Salmonella phage SPFM10]